MTDIRRTNFNTALTALGITLNPAQAGTGTVLNHAQLQEVLNIADAAGCKVTLGGVQASKTITPAATLTASLVITASKEYPGSLGNAITVAIADAGGDTLACTVSTTAISIALANTTDSKNTLTLIKALLDSTVGVGDNAGTTTRTAGTTLVNCEIVGTSTPGSAQLVHGGTNTLVASALTGGTDRLAITPA